MNTHLSLSRSLVRRHRKTFRAVTLTVVPEADLLTRDEWDALESIVALALQPRPPAMLRQLGLFMRVIDAAALLRGGRRFHALGAPHRTRILRSFETSSVLLLRRGLWGLRSLALMGYYARPEAGYAIGYRADARGWEARTA